MLKRPLRSIQYTLSLLTLLAGVLLSGCVTLRDPEASQPRTAGTAAQIAVGGSAGQSFISRRPGLNAILLWINLPPEAGNSGRLQARLYHAVSDGGAALPGISSQDAGPLRQVSLSFAQVRGSSPVTLGFEPLTDPPGQAYYLELTADAEGVQLQGRLDDVYAQGSATLDGQPLPADLAFETSYDYGLPAMLGDLVSALPGLWLALPLAVVLLLPGWLLLGLLPHPQPLPQGGRGAGNGDLPLHQREKGAGSDDLPLSRGGRGAGNGDLPLHQREKGAGSDGDLPLSQGGRGAGNGDLPLHQREKGAGSDGDLPLPQGGRGAGNGDLPLSRGERGRGEGMGLLASLALGLSLAVLPVLLTWTTALGLHWTRQSAWFAAGALAALAIWRAWAKRPASAGLPLPKISTASLALLGIFAVTLFARFVMVRDLAAPPWVDSIHHGVITRLLLDQGAFPASYAPYLEIDTARYHAGFHAGLAFFIWLSGLEMHSAMLIYGQVLNALIVFPAYLLTVQLTGSRRAGLFAALIAGLFTPMPAYYTSWGRYTQLAGLIILPAAFALCRLPQPQAAHGVLKLRRSVQIFLAAIACAGLFLTHYRVAAFLACLLAADWLVAALPALALRLNTSRLRLPAQPDNGSPGKGSPLPALAQLLLTAGLSLLLVLPWLPETFATLFIPKLSLWQGGNPEPFSGFAWSFLDTAWGKPAMALAALGLILGVVQRQSHPWVLALWAGLMLLLANLEPLGLPGGGFVTTLSVTISAFLPIAVAGGAFLDGVYNAGASLFSRLAHTVSRKIPSPEEEPAPARHGEEAHASEAGAATEAIPGVSPSRAGLSQVSPGSPPRQNNWLYAACWTAAALIAALFAARAQVTLLRPVTFLARQADFTAIRWAAANLPPGATALVNPAGWGYGLFQGEDGGYWLSPLAGIQTLPPPVIYGLDNNLERVGQVNSLVQAALDAAADPPALHRLLQENDIAYIFIGAKGGAFPASRLLESGLFQVLYHQDGAWIFQPAKIPPANAPY